MHDAVCSVAVNLASLATMHDAVCSVAVNLASLATMHDAVCSVAVNHGVPSDHPPVSETSSIVAGIGGRRFLLCR